MAAFCTSLAEHNATDVNIALQLEGTNPRDAIPPRLVEVLTKYMVFSLGGKEGKEGKEDSKVRVSSNWQRLKAKIFGRRPGGIGYLLLTRRFKGAAFEMVYYYDRATDREDLTLVGPLAKIDCRSFPGVGLPAPMEALEARGEVMVWFAEGSECEYGKQTASDSFRTPGLLRWWMSAAGPPRRMRIWQALSQKDMSVHVRTVGLRWRRLLSCLGGRDGIVILALSCLVHADGMARCDPGENCEAKSESGHQLKEE